MKRWLSLLLVLPLLFCTLVCAQAGSGITGFARVEKENVNVRKEPGGSRVHRLNAGETVFVREEKKDRDGQTWYLANVKPRNGRNITGWIRGDMLTLSRDIFTDVKKIAVGNNLIAVLKKDGTAIAMGERYYKGFDPDTVHWQDITDIAAGTCTVLGITADGGLVGSGNFVPSGYGDAKDALHVYMYATVSLILRKDGTVFASAGVAGRRYLPQNKGVPALPALSDDHIVWADALAISGGRLLDVYAGEELGQWSDVAGVAAGAMHRVILMRDGTVRAFGENHYGMCDVSGWTDIIQVACAEFRTVGLKRDGTVVAAGYNGYGECDVSGWRNIVQVACDSRFTVGLTADGQVLVAGEARFDYEKEHDALYAQKRGEREAIFSQAFEMDAGYE